MNKRQKEVVQHQLTTERLVLDELEKEYQEALKDINLKIQQYLAMPETQSRIYHRQYQENLKKQIEAALEKLHSDEYTTINQYLHDSYTDAFVGTMYDLHIQGVPVIAPIDQNAVIKAVMTDTRLNKPLYQKLGIDVNNLKKVVSSEISRGIASGLLYEDIARNIQYRTNAPIGRAKTIVRTEGHRIQQASAEDARQVAKSKGADVVKQWDATLDGKTRPTHRQLDGQIKETDERFELGNKKAMYPGDFGDPAEDCNCRCVALTRSRSALDEEELALLKERAKFFQLDKPKDFGDFKKKYTKAAEQETKNEATVAEISQKATETLLDAYEDRRKHFGLKYTPADEAKKAGLNPVKVDYTGLSVETAKVFADTFEELARDYYTGFTSIEVAERKEVVGVITYATTKHHETIAQKTLSINPLKTADYNALVKRIGELSKKGYCAEIKDDKFGSYVMTHEFAHSLLDMKTPLKNYVGMDEKPMRKARKEIEYIYSRYKADVAELEKAKRSIESRFMLAKDVSESEKLRKEFETVRNRLKSVKISDYSMKNSDEFLAEAFVQYKIGSIHSPYADELMAVVDKHFKKKHPKAAAQPYAQKRPNKPTRPRRRDFEDDDAYEAARERYRQDRTRYEAEVDKIVQANLNRERKYAKTAGVKKWAKEHSVNINDDVFDRVDTRTFDDVLEVQEEMFKRFPQGKKGWEIFGNKYTIGIDDDPYAFMSANGGLNFNGSYFRNFEDALRESIDMQDKGYTVYGDGSFKTHLRHEYGHNVDDYIKLHRFNRLYEGKRNAPFEPERRSEYERELLELATRSDASEYAKTNANEAFAEGFAEYTSNPGSAYGKAFGEFLRRWMVD